MKISVFEVQRNVDGDTPSNPERNPAGKQQRIKIIDVNMTLIRCCLPAELAYVLGQVVESISAPSTIPKKKKKRKKERCKIKNVNSFY
ncbi:MAG: hypothetical protein ABW098_20855 [Candidatus Thiodiazotropha sp.]